MSALLWATVWSCELRFGEFLFIPSRLELLKTHHCDILLYILNINTRVFIFRMYNKMCLYLGYITKYQFQKHNSQENMKNFQYNVCVAEIWNVRVYVRAHQKIHNLQMFWQILKKLHFKWLWEVFSSCWPSRYMQFLKA